VAQQAAAEGVDVDTFLLLYLSHRPVVDFDKQQVEAAFRTLGATTAAGEGPRGCEDCTSRPKPQAGHPCRWSTFGLNCSWISAGNVAL
jgi:hypothetical protein